MQNNNLNKNQKGVSLIITFFVMLIVLAIILSISILLYSEVKIIRNIGNSMVSLYAADSGIEKVLYYDNKIIPPEHDGITPKRGLCSMFDSANNDKFCAEDLSPSGGGNHSIFCNENEIATGTTNPSDGCNADVCSDCTISFNTEFDGRKYTTIAKVSPSENPEMPNFEIESKGTFEGAGRQIKIFMEAKENEEAIKVTNACVSPKSTPQGTAISISAGVSSTISGDSIASVTANIHDYNGNPMPGGSNISLVCDSGIRTSCNWYYTWVTTTSTPVGGYFVDLHIEDNLDPRNTLDLNNILPCF